MQDRSFVSEGRVGEGPAVELTEPGGPEGELSAQAYREMYAFLYSRVGRADDAADLTQEVWIRASRALRGGAAPRNVRAWLFQIAKNVLADWKRSESRRAHLGAAVTARRDAACDERIDDRVAIEEALGRLNGKMREAVVYVHMLGYSYEEAAEMAGVSVASFASRLHRARTKLRELLGPMLDREVGT
jgi:RNA polymerase sigma-70 factor (ECF subfamily)